MSDPWVGRTIGSYEITALLGRGGMGRVYQGRDTRLGRDVALKVLEDAEQVTERAMARFEREARVLAALNHPNIAAIYDIEQHEGHTWLVLELAAGPTLADRLARGPLTVAEAMPIARQVADALEQAHERGVVHRDLKPANIALDEDGRVKVLDFGIAKVVSADTGDDGSWPSGEPITDTREGRLVGTVTYMSPEQVRGRAVDRRADVWAFGVVLFEMLTGRQPFAGEDAAVVLARILEAEPDWRQLPSNLPPYLRHLLERCLVKDPKRRLQAIGEARLALEDDGIDPLGAVRRPAQPAWRRWTAAAAILAAGAALGWLLSGRQPPSLADDRHVRLPYTNGQLSPTGTAIVDRVGDDLHLYSLVDGSDRVLDDGTNALNVFWSYDGSTVGFRRDDRLWRIDVAGGPAVAITDLPQGVFYQAAWTADDRIVFSMPDGLYEVAAGGGVPHRFYERDEDDPALRDPEALPGGGVVVAVAVEGTLDLVEGGNRRTIVAIPDVVTRFPKYSPTGYLMFTVQRGARESIWAVPFSVARGEATGEPFQLIPDATVAFPARDGSLLYREAAHLRTQMVWVTREGAIDGKVGPLLEGLAEPALSPDGTRVAVSSIVGDSLRIQVLDLASGTMAPLSVAYDGEQDYPFWIAPGDRVGYTAFDRGVSTLIVRLLNGRRLEPALGSADGVGGIRGSGAWTTPTVTYQQQSEDLGMNIWAVPASGGDPVSIVRTPQHEGHPRLSPDDRFLAYIGGRTGFPDVFVTRFPEGDVRWPVSDGGGREPRWSPDGDRLFYWAGSTLMEVDVTRRGEELTFSSPRALFDAEDHDLLTERHFAVAADGRFLMVQWRTPDPETVPRLVLIPRWTPEAWR